MSEYVYSPNINVRSITFFENLTRTATAREHPPRG